MRSGPAAGITVLIDPQTEKFLWTGAHEVPVQKALVRLLRPGMSFWDVGAHTGFFSFLAARLVGPDGCVEAFEPLPENRSRLEVARTLNGASNVRVHACAVAGSSGDVAFYGTGESATWSLVACATPTAWLTVASRTLDELAQSLPPPDVLKIDAEGSELDVLRGGLRLLEARRPAVLVETETAAADAIRGIVPFYECRRLDKTHWLLSDAVGALD